MIPEPKPQNLTLLPAIIAVVRMVYYTAMCIEIGILVYKQEMIVALGLFSLLYVVWMTENIAIKTHAIAMMLISITSLASSIEESEKGPPNQDL